MEIQQAVNGWLKPGSIIAVPNHRRTGSVASIRGDMAMGRARRAAKAPFQKCARPRRQKQPSSCHKETHVDDRLPQRQVNDRSRTRQNPGVAVAAYDCHFKYVSIAAVKVRTAPRNCISLVSTDVDAFRKRP